MKGRKPTPTALKVLAGNPGKRPLNKNEPKHAPRAPGCPTWLPAEAKAEWRRVVPQLDRVGTLALVDRAALTAYAQQWMMLFRAERDIQVRGLILEDGKRNPNILTAKDAATQIRLFAAEFGLTPSSRSRMETPVAPDARATPAGDKRARFLS